MATEHQITAACKVMLGEALTKQDLDALFGENLKIVLKEGLTPKILDEKATEILNTIEDVYYPVAQKRNPESFITDDDIINLKIDLELDVDAFIRNM